MLPRFVWLGLVTLGLVAGCGQKQANDRRVLIEPGADERSGDGPRPVTPEVSLPTTNPPRKPADGLATGDLDRLVRELAAPTRKEEYERALFRGLNLLAERKLNEALAALEEARTAEDSEQVREEITRLKGILARQAANEKTILDIQTILEEGRAEEASRLAGQALLQFGGSEQAERVLVLKRQADALSAQAGDRANRRQRFLDEATMAAKENNLRGAAMAYEQALNFGEDAAIRQQLAQIQTSLKRYDECRTRANELRQDPTALEEALESLRDAQKAWDTPALRQEIADYTLALRVRRDRLAVIDFETRTEIGFPDAGRTIAEQLLPAFKNRFDLVERAQINRVLEEMKLDSRALLTNDPRSKQVGQVARVRYLVVGSVSRLGGITVNARLVDARSGLIVQTANVTGPTPEAVVGLLPRLAYILQLNDEQKIKYEEELARQAPVVAPIVLAANPPALPPEPIPAQQPAPPVVLWTNQPPEVGEIQAEEFDRLPPPPAANVALVPPTIVVEREEPIRRRLFQVALEIGDGHYRSGRYGEAFSQYEFALSLAPGHQELSLRLDRCRPHLPPPVVVIEAPRPRLAVINFALFGDPIVIPRGLGNAVAEGIAPYFSGSFDIIDRGQVYWYMRRLGLTVRDVTVDPAARRWLARAMGARYFLFGTLRQTGGVEATTHLVDAEYGFATGAARLTVAGLPELRLVLPELARLTLLAPAECQRQIVAVQPAQQLIIQAEKEFKNGRFGIAVEISNRALELQPNNVQFQFVFERFNKRRREQEWEEQRQRELARQYAIIAAQREQQLALARAAEEARIRAQQEAALRAEADRVAEQARREQAYVQLINQGQVALQQNNIQVSIQVFQSAVNLKQSDQAIRLLAEARGRADALEKARAAEAVAAREREVRLRREKELAVTRVRLEEERRRREEAERAQNAERETREKVAYQRLLDEAERSMASKKYDAAIASLQTARQLRNTPEVNRLLTQAVASQAEAQAARRGDRERVEAQKRFAVEQERRRFAENEAAIKRKKYDQLLLEAQQQMQKNQFDLASEKYQEAEKIFRTDAVLTGLRQANEGREREKLQREEARKQQEAVAKKRQQRDDLLTRGRASLEAGRHDEAITHLKAARELAPADVEILTALTRAEKARERSLLEARKRTEDAERRQSVQQLTSKSKEHLTAKRYAEAIESIQQGLRLDPGNVILTAMLKEAETARTARDTDVARQQQEKKAAEARREEERKRAEQVSKLLAAGRQAMQEKKWAEADRALSDVLKLEPANVTAANLKKQVQQTQIAEAKAKEEALARARQEEQVRARVKQLVEAADQAIAAGKWAEADKHLDEAARLQANDPSITRARAALRAGREKAETQQDAERKAREELARKKREEEARRAEAQRLEEKYQKAMRDGQAAMTARRYVDATREFNSALQAKPNDAMAKRLLQSAEDALKQPGTPAPVPDRKRAAFDDFMKQGRQAQAAKKYADAVHFFRAATEQIPGERTAQTALNEALRLLEAEKKSTTPPTTPPTQPTTPPKQPGTTPPPATTPGKTPPAEPSSFDQRLQAARAAEQQQNWNAAATTYRSALRLKPNDPGATAALRFAETMARGQQEFRARKYPQAAQIFEEALKLSPNHPDAKNWLQRARQGKP